MPAPAFRLLAAAVAAALLVAAPTAHAQTALSSGNWTSFTFGGVGSGAYEQPFTYTSADQFFVTVLDGYISGDQFELLAGGSLVGTTTAPTSDLLHCYEAEECLADNRFSRGTFLLGPGSYSFNVNTVLSPFDRGGAFIGVNVSDIPAGILAGDVTTTPEPASVALLASGLLALGGVAARRRLASR